MTAESCQFALPLESLRDLCRAVGIDPDTDTVSSITITVRAGELPRVTVERFPTRAEMDAISACVRKQCEELGVTPDVVAVAKSESEYGHAYPRVPEVVPTTIVGECGISARYVAG